MSLQEFAQSEAWTAAGGGIRQMCACLHVHVCGGFESWEGRNYVFDGGIQEAGCFVKDGDTGLLSR